MANEIIRSVNPIKIVAVCNKAGLFAFNNISLLADFFQARWFCYVSYKLWTIAAVKATYIETQMKYL